MRKSRNVSAGRLRERCEEIEMTKPLSICRQLKGNAFSDGRTGPYHHLNENISVQVYEELRMPLLDVVPDDGVRECFQGSSRRRLIILEPQLFLRGEQNIHIVSIVLR